MHQFSALQRTLPQRKRFSARQVVRSFLFGLMAVCTLSAHAGTTDVDVLRRKYTSASNGQHALSALNELNDALLAEGRFEELATMATDQWKLGQQLIGQAGLAEDAQRSVKGHMARAQRFMGICAFQQQAFEQALVHLRDGLAIWEGLGDLRGMSMARWNIGTIHMGQGDFGSALRENLLALELRKQLGDTLELARSYNNLGVIRYELGDYRTALEDHRTASVLWEKLGDRRDVAGSYNNIGALHMVLGDYPEAVRFFRKAHELALELNDDRGVVAYHNNMGEVHERWGDQSKALKEYFDGLAVAEKVGDDDLVGYSHFNIGNMLLARGDAPGAMGHFTTAMARFQRRGDRSKIAEAHTAMGAAHTRLGQQEQALRSYTMALEVQREIGARPSAVRTLLKIGELYATQGRQQDAIARYREALGVNMIVGDPFLEVDIHQHLGDALLAQGDAVAAEQYLQAARRAAERTGYRRGMMAAYGALARVHRKLGDNDRAYQLFEQFTTLKDSLFNEESGRRIDELRMRYEVDIKEKELMLKDNELQLMASTQELQRSRLERQRNALRYLVAGFILLLLFGWVAVRLYLKQRRSAYERAILETEQKALRAQMNPHFIFNVLNSIQYFAGRNDMASVELYLNKFTRLIRAILEQSRSPFIQLSQELATLRLYLELEKMRFEDKFDYTIAVDPDLEPERIRIPGMLVQPLVENAIKHGISNKKGEALVQLHFASHGDTLRCTVADNGIGREAARGLKASANGQDHRSVATTIIQERMESLSAIHRIQLSCTTEDLHDEQGQPSGTRVVVELPLERLT